MTVVAAANGIHEIAPQSDERPVLAFEVQREPLGSGVVEACLDPRRIAVRPIMPVTPADIPKILLWDWLWINEQKPKLVDRWNREMST